MDCSTPGFLVLCYLLEIAVWFDTSLLKLVSIESKMPSSHLILCHPLLFLPSIFPSVNVFSKWVGSSHQVAKVLELQRQSFQEIFRVDWSSCCPRDHQMSPSASQFKTIVRALYLTLCNPVDYSLPGFFLRGILQARILEWLAILFSRGSACPRDWTQVSCISGRFFTVWATREAHMKTWQHFIW